MQQTCLLKDEGTESYKMNGYTPHFNSAGNGKGICIFFNNTFALDTVISEKSYQISKLVSKDYDFISVYRSSDSNRCNQKTFCSNLSELINQRKNTIISGDFNINGLIKDENSIPVTLVKSGLKQIIQKPTHIRGGLIDQCYVSEGVSNDCLIVRQKAVYYTDHDLVKLMVMPTAEL